MIRVVLPAHLRTLSRTSGEIQLAVEDPVTQSSVLDAPVEVQVEGGTDAAVVTVRDHGTGIPAEDRERIFEKFARGRVGLTRGSGLGLYLAREIVDAHGGRIWVDATEGGGATLRFTLPIRGADRAR